MTLWDSGIFGCGQDAWGHGGARFSRSDAWLLSSSISDNLRVGVDGSSSALTVDDFVRILREPNASLTEQYTALMETEGVSLAFTDDGLARIAEVAWQVNEKQENIGARRLHTVMERLLETVSFDASDMVEQTITIDADYVNEHLGELSLDEDLSQYIL